MKELEKVRKKFFSRKDVKLLRELQLTALSLREKAWKYEEPLISRAVAIMAERWRTKESPEEPLSESFLRRYAYCIASDINERALAKDDPTADDFKLVTASFRLLDVSGEIDELKKFIEDNAEGIVEEYHKLFDD